MRRLLFAIFATVLLLSGCSSTSEASIDTTDKVVIDVRTPSEYASGHLEGAQNINLESADFSTQIAQLDPDVEYVVYCHSGNRSAQATAIMENAGLTVTDAGGIDAASSATGLAIVTN